MLQKSLEHIELEDLHHLIVNRIPEGRQIEYKLLIEFDKKEAKEELLFDLCSFANSDGGYLIVGIECSHDGDNKGLPSKLIPITDSSSDEYLLRIESLVRDSIAPKLRIYTKAIEYGSGFLVVFYVPKGNNGPYTLRSKPYFYIRASNSKHRLDLEEIRKLFLEGNNTRQRIRSWTEERLGLIVGGGAPARIRDTGLYILHIVPVNTFGQDDQIDLKSCYRKIHDNLGPSWDGGWGSSYNVDGLALFNSYTSYMQLFRDGTVEVVQSDLTHEVDGQHWLSAYRLESVALTAIDIMLRGLPALGVEYPFGVYQTLNGMGGARIKTNFMREGQKINRNTIHLPSLYLDEPTSNLASLLKPSFDIVWNAGGFSGSPSFKEDGSYHPIF